MVSADTAAAPSIGYSAIEGMPAGLNGPNVIVVDTSSLKTREEEEKEKKGKKKKKNKNKVDSDPLAKSASVGVMPSYMSPVIPRSATTISVAAPSSTSGGSSQTGTGNTSSNSTSSSNAAAAAANSLKSGPQVLIKNINGKVTITPVPGTGTGNAAEMVQQQQTPVVEPIPHKNSSSKQAQQQQQKVQPPQSNSSLLQNSSQQQQSQVQVNGVKKSPAPQMRQILDNNATINVQKSHSVPNVNGHMQNQQHNQGRQQNSNKNNGNACPDHNEINEGTKKFSFNSADGDDPDKVFAPSNDIDLEKADDSDRVVEQFKRFLAGPSPSPDQPRVRPKVELDMKNIFKKKAPTVFNSHGNLSSVSAVAEQATPSTTTS